RRLLSAGSARLLGAAVLQRRRRGDLRFPARGAPRVLRVSWSPKRQRRARAAPPGDLDPRSASRPRRIFNRHLPAARSGSPMKLSVIMPVYNEARTVREIVRQGQAVQVRKEILVVSDGSDTGTPAQA